MSECTEEHVHIGYVERQKERWYTVGWLAGFWVGLVLGLAAGATVVGLFA